MNSYLLVGAGGFAGAILRYWVGGIASAYSAVFPLGTMAVNLIGAFVLGLVMYSSEFAGVISPEYRLLIGVGLLGAFTTMSTFGYESFKLLEQNQPTLFATNIIVTIVGVLAAVYAAKICASVIWGV